MTQNGHNRLTPAEQELLRRMDQLSNRMADLNGAQVAIMQYLEGIKMQLEELQGRSGSMVLSKSTDDALALYEAMKQRHPGLTLKEFAEQNYIPVKRLYVARSRGKETVRKRRKR